MGTVTTFTFTSDTETVTRTKLNNLVANLLTEFNGEIDDANVAADASIAATKLNLATIAQNVAFTGTLDFSSATITAATTFADLTATTIDINGGSIDGATLGAASACTLTDVDINGGNLAGVTVDGSLTWSAAQDLNNQALTNVNIDSGTIAGANLTIPGTPADGELCVADSSDYIDGLGSQGTSGQYLQSQGAGSNPTWATVASSIDLISATSFSGEQTKDIPIVQDSAYLVFVRLEAATNNNTSIYIQFGPSGGIDTGSNYIEEGNAMSSPNDTKIDIATIDQSSVLGWMMGSFKIDTVSTDRMAMIGSFAYQDISEQVQQVSVCGAWDNSATVTQMRVSCDQASGLNGEVLLYKLNAS